MSRSGKKQNAAQVSPCGTMLISRTDRYAFRFWKVSAPEHRPQRGRSEASRAECGTPGVHASCRSGHDLCSQAAACFPLQAFQSRFQEAQFAAAAGMVVLPRPPKPHFLQSPLPWVYPRLQAEFPGNRCSLPALLVKTLETARLRAVTIRYTPNFREGGDIPSPST